MDRRIILETFNHFNFFFSTQTSSKATQYKILTVGSKLAGSFFRFIILLNIRDSCNIMGLSC